MNTQMYPFLRIAIVLVAGIMTGDVLYGHVPVRLVFCVLVVLVCITIVAYKKSGIPRLTTSLLMLDVFVLGVWNVGRVEQRLDQSGDHVNSGTDNRYRGCRTNRGR